MWKKMCILRNELFWQFKETGSLLPVSYCYRWDSARDGAGRKLREHLGLSCITGVILE